MEKHRLTDFTKGWVVGNFEPSLLKENFEVGIHRHHAGEFHQDHFHKKCVEINIVTSGEILINGQKFIKDDIFVFNPYEVSQVEYLTDVELVVIRNISDPTDKYEINIIDNG
jgi:hypothetical protein